MPLPLRSEIQLDSHLADAFPAGTRHKPESTCTQTSGGVGAAVIVVSVRIPKLRVIENAEELASELELLRFGQLDFFKEPKFPVTDSRSVEESPVGGSKLAKVPPTEQQGVEICCLRPSGVRQVLLARVSEAERARREIRLIRTASRRPCGTGPKQRMVILLGDEDRKTCVEACYPRQLPAPRSAVGRKEFFERQLIYEAWNEVVSHVKSRKRFAELGVDGVDHLDSARTGSRAPT